MHPCFTRALVAAGVAFTLGCRAFESSIPEREGTLRVEAHSVPVSMADEYPDELADGSAFEPPTSHVAGLPDAPSAARLASDELVRIEFSGAALVDVLDELAARGKVDLLHEHGLTTRLDLSMPELPLAQAFDWILARNDLHLEPLGPTSYRVVPGRVAPRVQTTFHLRSTTVDAVAANVSLLAGGDTRIVLDAAAGVVVAQGDPANLREIAAYLDEVDRRPEQVLVEARILEVTLGENFGLGVTGMVDGSIDGGTLGILQNLAIADDSFGLTLGSSDGTVEATILAISQYVGTDLVSSPRVLALSGSEALIEVTREVPYVQVTSTTTATTGGVGSQTLQEVEFKEAGVRLKVTPIIEDGGYVRMRVDQEFSEVAERYNDIPVIDRRTIGVNFLVRDRETVVLGGLMQDRRSESDKGVPGLASIPLLGRLFRSDEDDRRKRELIVFLTPRVVDDPESRRIVHAMRRAYADSVNRTGVRATTEPQVSPW